MALLAYAGPVEDGERALAPFRDLATPIADMVGPMPYPELYPPEAEGYHPVAAIRTMFVDGIDRQAADTIVEPAPGLDRADEGHAATGARRRDGPRARGRHRVRPPRAAGSWPTSSRSTSAPRSGRSHEDWVAGLAAELRQDDDGAYVGFLGDEGEERVRAAYPGATWDRLAAIKARYDPDNLFRLNQNVPPAAG